MFRRFMDQYGDPQTFARKNPQDYSKNPQDYSIDRSAFQAYLDKLTDRKLAQFRKKVGEFFDIDHARGDAHAFYNHAVLPEVVVMSYLGLPLTKEMYGRFSEVAYVDSYSRPDYDGSLSWALILAGSVTRPYLDSLK